jgi:hypothetical protein
MTLAVLLWSAWLSAAQLEDKPPEKCPALECPAGQRPVGKYGIITARGCPDGGGISMFNAGSFDPNDPMGSMKKQNSQSDKVHKCCVDRDICRSTCGMDAEQCHADFQKCSKKVCKGDKNCMMMSSLSDILGGANQGLDKIDENETPGCMTFRGAQQAACKCVKEDEWQPAVEKHLTKFFKKHNKEKLTAEGELKDPESVWDKWRGKEPEMFATLYTKYKAKAVTVPPKPKRDDPFGGFGGMPPPPAKEKKEKKKKKKAPEPEEAAADADDAESGFDEDL